jgi:predicted dehydrogenase
MSTERSERRATGKTKRIRVGIVGCGEVAQIMHWHSLYQLPEYFEVTALCDISRPVLDELGGSWNINNLTTDHRELVARADVDAVLVSNPNAYHAEVTLDAIAASKHVLVEKPMCVTRREAETIIAAQKQHGVCVQVGYMRRYAPAFVEACAMVKEIGEIRFARVRDLIGFNSLIINPTSRVIRDEALGQELKAEARAREDSLYKEALGATASESVKRAYTLMLGLSSHDISAMRELLGMPSRVLFAAERKGGIYLVATFDYGSFVCQFETGVDQVPRFDAHLQVYGDAKVVRVQYDTPYVRNLPIRLFVTESNGQSGVRETELHPAWGDPFVEEWKAFHNNIMQGNRPKSDPTDFAQDLELFAQMVRLIRDE